MQFNTILFSKNHLINPFKMDYKNKEISIRDKKIITIALSILVGVLTAALGGILFFYCLCAKYKLQKVNDAIAASKKNDQMFINEFVSCFLHPYVTGEITKETDADDRKPMVDLLREKISQLDSSKKAELEEMAFDAFFEKAALGLYVNKRITSRDIDTECEEFGYLVNALNQAVPREFPDRQISPEELINKASAALIAVNAQRKLAQNEAVKFEVKGDADVRYAKLRLLEKRRKMFF